MYKSMKDKREKKKSLNMKLEKKKKNCIKMLDRRVKGGKWGKERGSDLTTNTHMFALKLRF